MSASMKAVRIEMVGLTSRGARLVTWVYFLAVATLGVWNLDGVRSPYPTLIAIGLFLVACIAVTRSRDDHISLRLSVFIIAVGVVACALISWQLKAPGGYAQWYLGTSIAGLFIINLRGRIGLSWIGFALIGTIMLSWGVSTGLGWADSIFIVVQQTPILIVGTLFATGLRLAGDQVRRFAAVEAARAITEGEQRAISLEREERLQSLGEQVSPMLELLARGDTPDAAQRVEFALAEAELRDSLRARSFTGTTVPAAAREARRRGIEVILLDDSDPGALAPNDFAAAIARVTRALTEARVGRVTVRLLPPGRGSVVTIVVDSMDPTREDSVSME